MREMETISNFKSHKSIPSSLHVEKILLPAHDTPTTPTMLHPLPHLGRPSLAELERLQPSAHVRAKALCAPHFFSHGLRGLLRVCLLSHAHSRTQDTAVCKQHVTIARLMHAVGVFFFPYKYMAMVLLIAQTTATVLAMRISRTVEKEVRRCQQWRGDVSHMV